LRVPSEIDVAVNLHFQVRRTKVPIYRWLLCKRTTSG